MGVLRFVIPRADDLAADVDQRAYVVSLEGIPWQCRVERQGDALNIVRQVADSGYAHVPWVTSQYGELMLATATVVERREPYRLVVELARGAIHRVANQLSDWRLSGLEHTEPVEEVVARAKHLFARAVAGGNTLAASDQMARESLETALEAAEDLVTLYTSQVVAMRRREPTRIPTWLAGNLGAVIPAGENGTQFTETFTAAALAFSWRTLEPVTGDIQWRETDRQVAWCAEKGLRICGGPLFGLDALDLPDWLVLWEDRIEEVAAYTRQHVERVVRRYRDRVHLWHCAARVNNGRGLAMSEEDRLQMTAMVLETLRKNDSQTPVIVSMDQPWGEYMARTETDLAPLYFADALLRADLGVTGIGLELNYGYAMHGMSARDRLAISRKLDQWSVLGVPLAVFLTVPSSSAADPHARDPQSHVVASSVDDVWQQSVAHDLLSLLMAKRYVQVVVWDQWSDAMPHRFPNAGLCDDQSRPKAVLSTLREMRREMLG